MVGPRRAAAGRRGAGTGAPLGAVWENLRLPELPEDRASVAPGVQRVRTRAFSVGAYADRADDRGGRTRPTQIRPSFIFPSSLIMD